LSSWAPGVSQSSKASEVEEDISVASESSSCESDSEEDSHIESEDENNDSSSDDGNNAVHDESNIVTASIVNEIQNEPADSTVQESISNSSVKESTSSPSDSISTITPVPGKMISFCLNIILTIFMHIGPPSIFDITVDSFSHSTANTIKRPTDAMILDRLQQEKLFIENFPKHDNAFVVEVGSHVSTII
jgi:hypothetical protein